MLASLSIKNIAIIDELTVDFERGFNVMTGETGAGKTIVVQALSLVLGARASAEYIRTGESEAMVAASFLIGGMSSRCVEGIRRLCESNDIDIKDELIIRRVISVEGRSKVTVNGVPVTLQMLKDIACHLVDVSSQHENQMLIDPSNHVQLVDDFGVSKKIRDAYAVSYAKYSRLREEVMRLRSDGADAKEKLDFLKYQLNELKAASPQPGEIEEIEEKRLRLKHAVTLEAAVGEAVQLLYESGGSAVEILDRSHSTLSAASQLDPVLRSYCEVIQRAEAEVAEAAHELEAYTANLNAEPAEMEALEDRLHLLKGLIKKHGCDLQGLIEKQGYIEKEIDLVENRDDILAAKESELERAHKELRQAARTLSEQRKQAAEKLSSVVQLELQSLAMGKTRFVVTIEQRAMEDWDSTGPDHVEFFVSPNIGEDPRPLARTASGGELSRVMLAIKRVLADRANLAATYVFDEVDAGIGGATAEVVGRKLFEVAKNRQVLCITHLPQVACFGSTHYRIQKKITKGRTITDMVVLKEDERVKEIARMLGGTKVTDVTLANAKELIRNTAD